MTVREVVESNESSYKSKFLEHVKRELMKQAEQEYSYELFSRAWDRVFHREACQNHRRKGKKVYNNKVYCDPCFDKLKS